MSALPGGRPWQASLWLPFQPPWTGTPDGGTCTWPRTGSCRSSCRTVKSRDASRAQATRENWRRPNHERSIQRESSVHMLRACILSRYSVGHRERREGQGGRKQDKVEAGQVPLCPGTKFVCTQGERILTREAEHRVKACLRGQDVERKRLQCRYLGGRHTHVALMCCTQELPV